MNNSTVNKHLIRSFREDFNEIIRQNTDKIAITTVISSDDTQEINFSYSELKVLIQKTSFLFKKNNIKSGDEILAILPNSSELATIFLSCAYSGVNFIPMPCEITNFDIDNIFSITKPKLCIISKLVSPKFIDTLKKYNIEALEIDTNGDFVWLPEGQNEFNPEKPANIYVTTSGTTGEPKIMVINIDKLWSSGYEFLKFHDLLDSSLRFWNYLPMSYLGGLFNLCLIPFISKGSTVITETFSGKSFLTFWQTIERFDINAIWFTPSIVKGLIMFGERMNEDLRKNYSKNIKVSFLGTAPINLETKQAFEKLFSLTLLENFALSETTFFTSEKQDTIKDRSANSVGEVLPYTNLNFRKIETNISEILVKTPFLFEGYLTKEGLIKPCIDDQGYFPTADLGQLNENNILVISGRNRDIIKKGGYFISLREIELLVEKDPEVQEAVAVKIPHEFYGESFNLYVILKDELSDQSKLNQRILNNLIKYKWPESIIIKKNFPRTSSGKVKKELLIEE